MHPVQLHHLQQDISVGLSEQLNGILLLKALLQKQQRQGRLRGLPKQCSKAVLEAGSVPRAPEAMEVA